MRYLLDTNIFLWWLNSDKKLQENVREIIKESKNQIYVSVASAWEISIKHNAGKLPLKTTLQKCFEISGFKVVDITLAHTLELEKLPLYHKDPFDRMLISQARVENLILITNDPKIKRYDVECLT